jgi:hypothetical protein
MIRTEQLELFDNFWEIIEFIINNASILTSFAIFIHFVIF